MLPSTSNLRILCWVLLLLTSTAVSAGDANTQRQLNNLNEKIESLKKSLGKQQDDRSSAVGVLRNIEKDIGRLAAELRHTNSKYNQQQRKLAELTTRQQQLAKQQLSQKALIAEHVRSAYTLGNESQLKMLLNQEQPEKLSRTLTYFDYFNRARSEELNKYRNTLAELASLRPAIETETQTLAVTSAKLKRQQLAFIQQKQQRTSALAGLDREILNNTSSLNNLDKERKSLESVLQAVEREINNIAMPENYQPFKAMRGKMPWPVTGKLLNRFGASRQGSAVAWQGIQIAGREGDAVLSIHNGRVVFADWLRGAGLLIIVDHGGGYLSLYAHNQSLLRTEGDWVKGGEAVATVGNSGGQRQAGLYFEIRYQGRPTDPRSWCR